MQPFFEIIENEYRLDSIRALSVHLKKKRSRWHYHPEIELTFVYSGRGKRIVGDHVGNFYPGQLMLTGEDLPHDFNTSQQESNCHILVIQFNKSILATLPEFDGVRKLLDTSKQGILFNSVPKDIHDCFAHYLDLPPALKIVYLYQALVRLVQTLPQNNFDLLSSVEFTKYRLDQKSHDRLNKVIGYIDENKGKPISLAEISEQTFMTIPAFCRWFKNAMHVSFVNYLNKTRVEEACRLMVNTDKQIGHIALECGFESYSNFNRAFSKLYNVTPREYRKTLADAIQDD